MKKLWVYISAVSCVFLTSCSETTVFSEYREIENIEMMQFIGVDKTENGITVITGSGKTPEAEPKTYKKEAETLSIALNELEKMPVGKEMLLSHVNCLVLGEEAAREGITECLDYIGRESDLRMDTGIYIVAGDSAENFISDISGQEASVYDMLELLRKDITRLGKGFVFTAEDIASALSVNGYALAMGVCAEKTEELSGKDGKMVAPGGFALLKAGKLTTFLNEDETKGTALVLNKTKSATERISLPEGMVTLLLTGEKTSILPNFDEGGGLSSIQIKTDLEANILSINGSIDITDEKTREDLEECLSEKEKGYISAALSCVETEETDFLDIGERLVRRYPVRLSGWREKAFLKTGKEVEIHSVIRRTYDMDRPINVFGKGTDGKQ